MCVNCCQKLLGEFLWLEHSIPQMKAIDLDHSEEYLHLVSFATLKEAADEHDSCTNNLYEALKELDLQLAEDPRKDYYTPAPFNLWWALYFG